MTHPTEWYDGYLPLVHSKSQWESAKILLLCLLGVAVICLFSQCSMTPARAEELPSNERIAQAIYHAENSKKYPYGIKSINTYGNKEYARKICLNSIRNAKKRWIKAGMPEDFLVYMGRRFSPPDINPNWVRLVKHFLGG